MLGSYDLVKKLNNGNSRYFLFSLLFVLGLVFSSSELEAASLIKKVDGIEVNWSTSRFRSSGEASIEEFSTAGISSSDTKAWNNGLVSIGEDSKKLASVLIPGGVSEEGLGKLEKSVRSSSYTVNTEYYGTKGIRVIVENRISKIYKSMNLSFLPKDQGGASSKNTGIIFQLSSHVEPSGVYNLYDGSGNVLFSSSLVYEDAFDYYTMGRWFNSSSKSDIAKVVGDNPVVVRVDVKDGKMVVSDMDTWNLIVKDNRSLLANVKIAVVVD